MVRARVRVMFQRTARLKDSGYSHDRFGPCAPGTCSWCCERVKSLNEHYRNKHQPKTTCRFSDRLNDDIHVTRDADDGTFHCPRCSFSSPSSRNLQVRTPRELCRAEFEHFVESYQPPMQNLSFELQNALANSPSKARQPKCSKCSGDDEYSPSAVCRYKPRKRYGFSGQ